MSTTDTTHSTCGTPMVLCKRHLFRYCPTCERSCLMCSPEWNASPRNNGLPALDKANSRLPTDLYAERLAFRRADQEAQRKLAAESRPPIRKPEVLTLRERLARPRPPIQWRIEGWQPAGSRVLVAAQYKAGKTTLVGNLSRSLVDGDPFLDSHTVAAVDKPVGVIDLEMNEHQLDGWYADMKIRNDDQVFVIPLRGNAAAFDILDAGIRTQWAELLKSRGCGYLIVDCLRPALDALGLDEHREAGRFLIALDALLADAGIPDAAVIHHMGHVAERSRGDSRIRDWPDVEWRLVREDDDPSSPRYISAYGRDVEITESRLGYDPATRRLSIGRGSRKDATARAALADILKMLDAMKDKMSGRQIEDRREMVDHAQKAIRAGIKLGIKEGSIGTEPGPRRSTLHFSASVRHSASASSDALVSECVSAYRDDALTTHSTDPVSASDQNSSSSVASAYDKEAAEAVFARLRAQREADQ
jgi:AAA domain